jgi:hypothetical protein
MSLRPAKVGLLRKGFKNLNAAGLNNYCTKARPADDTTVVVITSGSLQRRSNEIFGTNPSFPFPGGVSVDNKLIEHIRKENVKSLVTTEKSNKLNPLNQPSVSEGLLCHHISEITEILDKRMRILTDPKVEQEPSLRVEVMKADRDMELKASPCPKVMKKDLSSLFVDMEFDRNHEITVLNLTQKSQTDMSAWSEEMEVERDMLTKDFINIASAICHDIKELSEGNYWADFIEPTSGRPYFSKYTNATLFETDDRYRDLGFQIEDMGCCKVVKHMKWSTHAFVGTIFTNAPLNSVEVKAILSNSKTGRYFQENPQS